MDPTTWTDEDLVAELADVESGLTDWEVRFVESIAAHVEGGGALTDRQRAKAAQIIETLEER